MGSGFKVAPLKHKDKQLFRKTFMKLSSFTCTNVKKWKKKNWKKNIIILKLNINK
jgi:hypothetical protein